MAKYIDKEKLLLFMAEKYCMSCTKIDPMCTACLVDDMRFEIADAPTEDVVEVVHGEWIKKYCWEEDYVCSVCGELAHKNAYGIHAEFTNYCPNCGAKMDGKGDGKTSLLYADIDEIIDSEEV